MDELVFTPVAVLDFLSQITELQDYDITLTESNNGLLQITIGSSVYTIDTSHADSVFINSDALSDVKTANHFDEPYIDNNTEYPMDSVQSGMIREIAKTLFVGGLVRLTNKILKKK